MSKLTTKLEKENLSLINIFVNNLIYMLLFPMELIQWKK